jgi:hypothetical protein
VLRAREVDDRRRIGHEGVHHAGGEARRPQVGRQPERRRGRWGEPFLAGYCVMLYDGNTVYQVAVLDGKGVPFFGNFGDKVLKYTRDDYNKPTAPETDRQRTSVAAAVEYVKGVAPNARPSGISQYLCFFPKVGAGAGASYPSAVGIGGTEVR